MNMIYVLERISVYENMVMVFLKVLIIKAFSWRDCLKSRTNLEDILFPAENPTQIQRIS